MPVQSVTNNITSQEPGTQQTNDAQPAVATQEGAGVQALQQLLARGGQPAPEAVVDIIDKHRGERDKIFALLQTTLGNGYVQQVAAAMDHLRVSVKQREVVAGDPSNPEGGFFDASQAENGAKWRTKDGSFSGTANKDGLDTKYQPNPHDAAHLKVDKGGAGSLAWEHDGKNEGELEGHYKSGTDWEAGARRTDQVGNGALTYGARHQVTAAGANDGVTAEYKSTDQKTAIGGMAALQDGHPIGEVHGSEKLANGATIAGNASVAREGGGEREAIGGSYNAGKTQISGSAVHHANDSVTGNLTATHQLDPKTSLTGAITRDADKTSITASGTEQFSPEHKLTGNLGYTAPDHGKGQADLAVSDRYRSPDLVTGLDLKAGTGTRDYASVTGSMDAHLGKNLYGGAFGSYSTENGKHDQASLGASLTFTPSEKTALTLAGVIDQSGALETRLQLDVFKSKIANVGDLADHKKDALVSLFVSYTQGGNPGMLNDRFGAPQESYGRAANEGQVMAGIRLKF